MARLRSDRGYAAPMPARPSPARGLLLSATVASLGLGLAACGSGGVAPISSRTVGRTGSGRTVDESPPRATRCAPASAPAPKTAAKLHKPTRELDPSRRYVVDMQTNCGTIEIQLDVRDAPRTSASFAYLVRRGFYDDLTFHRVAAGFVIQGGDPDGDGSGGPGYTVVEPPPSDVRYTLGTVAMAKTATDPAGASGSQFFIVTAREADLPAQYALVGNVVGGLAGVEAIAKLPTDPPQDGAPETPVVISRATLSSS
jgi:peptidyl-prolyl cis-trans isomerase B (cyclophilin B)